MKVGQRITYGLDQFDHSGSEPSVCFAFGRCMRERFRAAESLTCKAFGSPRAVRLFQASVTKIRDQMLAGLPAAPAVRLNQNGRLSAGFARSAF